MLTVRKSRCWPVMAAVVAVAAVLVGCSGGNVPAKTMTLDQATARAEQVVKETGAALTPRPALDFDPRLPNESGVCLANIPHASQMVSVDRTAWLRKIPASQNSSIGQQILAYWKKQGYSISDQSGFADAQPSIDAVTKDGFTVSLGTAKNGWMSVGASSPCVYPHGTPPSGT